MGDSRLHKSFSSLTRVASRHKDKLKVLPSSLNPVSQVVHQELLHSTAVLDCQILGVSVAGKMEHTTLSFRKKGTKTVGVRNVKHHINLDMGITQRLGQNLTLFLKVQQTDRMIAPSVVHMDQGCTLKDCQQIRSKRMSTMSTYGWFGATEVSCWESSEWHIVDVNYECSFLLFSKPASACQRCLIRLGRI